MGALVVGDFIHRMIAEMHKYRDLIVPLLPEHVRFELILAQLERYLRENPKMCECHPVSLFWSFVEAAEAGLTVGSSVLGEASILAFTSSRDQIKRAQFVPGYKGLIKLAYQSGFVTLCSAYVIYEKDVFQCDLGDLERPVVYKPYLGMELPGKVVAAYAQVTFKSGQTHHDVMPLWKLEEIRKAARGGADTPWNTHRDEMQRKSVIRHSLKDAPKSRELAAIIARDEAYEAGVQERDEREQDLPLDPRAVSVSVGNSAPTTPTAPPKAAPTPAASAPAEAQPQPQAAPGGRAAQSRARVQAKAAAPAPAPALPPAPQQALSQQLAAPAPEALPAAPAPKAPATPTAAPTAKPAEPAAAPVAQPPDDEPAFVEPEEDIFT